MNFCGGFFLICIYNYSMSRLYPILLFGIIFSFFIGCNNEKFDEKSVDFSVNIRLSGDPEMLHPMLSRTAGATQIESKIFQSLQEYNPTTLLLEPVLIKQAPSVDTVDGFTVFSMEIRKEAEWMDSQPLTALDYNFTLKASLIPSVASAWGGVLSFISKVDFDEENPKELTVYVESDYLLGEQIATNFMIYPEHIYDSLMILRKFTVEELKDFENLTDDQKSELNAFADQFKQNIGNKGALYGSGPYFLSSYTKDRQLSLERVNDWWGEDFIDESPNFAALPLQLNYIIIPDEFTAINALQQGVIDVMAEVPPKDFTDLKLDEKNTKLAFYTPAILQNYIMTINNRDPILEDKVLRKAIAHGINVQIIIDNLFYGQAERSAGPIHPSKSFFNKKIQPIEFNKEKAIQLLEDNGWKLNSDGIRYKNMNGEDQALTFNLSTSDKQLGQDFAQIISKQLAEIGIKIEISAMDVRTLIKNARSKNYQLALLAIKQNPGWEDPYPYWHSDSDNPGGNNFFAYQSSLTDSIINLIRDTKNPDELNAHYYEFQRIIYEDQPAVFLVNPQERLIVNRKFDISPSILRPGYFENSFKLNE